MRWFLAVAILWSAALAQSPALSVKDGWIRVVPVIADTAAYFTLVNTGNKPVRLVGGSTAVAAMVMPMAGTTEVRVINGIKQEIKGMKTVRYLEVPARGRLALQPGGDHLMLMGLKRPLKEGELVALELRFEDGSRLKVNLPAQAR